MDDNDVKGGNILNGNDKEIEESLKKALDGNEAHGRKGKTFGTFKRLPTQVTENLSEELSKTTEAVAPQVRATEFKTTALSSTQTRLKSTTLMPESLTENENNEENKNILRTKSFYSTRNKVTTLKPETSTTYEEDLESTTRSNIYKARPSRLPFKDVVEKSESFTDGISFSTERVEESTFLDDLTEENEKTTTLFSIPHKVENFEVETKAEPTTDNINKITVSDHEFENSKPTKSSTENSSIKKVENVTVKILEELESTTEKNLLEETTDSAFTTEEATTISLSPKNVLIKNRISTTPPAIEAESATEIDSNLENTTEISNGFESKSLTELIARKTFTKTSRPLVKPTTNIIKNEGIETSEHPTESTTHRDILLPNRQKGVGTLNRLRTTTSKIINEELNGTDEEEETKENFITFNKSPITTTTESPSNSIATTKRSFSRLIRYGTTTPQSHKLGNEKDEDKDLEKIETSKRGFKRFQISTTEVVNEDINSTLESNNKTLKDKKVSSKGISTNRPLFGGLTTTKTLAPETSQSSRSFVLNRSKTTSTITTDKEDNTTKHTPPTRKSFEGFTRPTTAFTETSTEKAEKALENNEENTTERSLLIRRPFGGPKQITTTETTSVETNSIIENNEESTLKEEVYTTAKSSQDATTKATIEEISITLLNAEESSSNAEDSTEASIDSAYSTDINNEVFSNDKATENSINNSENKEKYNSSVSKGTNENFESTTEYFTESFETIPTTVKAAIEEVESTPVNNKYTTSEDFNQDITTVTESITEKDGSTDDFNEDSEAVTTQRTLSSIRPFGKLNRSSATTQATIEENETTIKDSGSTEEVTTKRSLTSRRQFGGFNRPTTTQSIFDDAGSTVGDDTIEEEATTERTVPTRRPFGGFNQRTTTHAIVEENISTEKETEDSTTIAETTTKGTLPTRRPFGKLNRSSATTQATIEESETTIKDSGSSEEVTTKRALHSKITFELFNRPTTTQTIFDDAGSTVDDDNIEEQATTERTVPTRRPFGGFNQRTTTQAIAEENISTEKETEDSTTIAEATTKGTLPTRRPFGKLNRSSATTQATIEESETTIKDSGSSEEVTTKRTLPSKRTFGLFNRPTTTLTIFDDAGSTVGDDTIGEQATTERTVPTRRPFGGFNQQTTTQAIAEENISTEKETEDSTTRNEATTQRTLPTRRPFGRTNRTSSSTQATIDITDDTEESRTQEEDTGERTLPTRRSFGGFKRPTVDTKKATIPETESLEEDSNKNVAYEEVKIKHILPTQRPIQSLTPLTTSQNVKNDKDDTAAEEITTTRTSFGGFTRPTTTTTEATTQNNDSAVEIKKETILNSEISSKRTLFTRKPFVRFTRPPTTTTKTGEESVTETLDQDIDENFTRRPFPASKLNEFTTTEATIEKSTDESIPATSTQNEDISTIEKETTNSVIETNFKTIKEIQTQSVEHQKILTEIFEASTVKDAWETLTPTSETFTDNENSSTTEFESAISITKAAVQSYDNNNTDSLKYLQTKTERFKPNTIEEALEISTHTSVEETSTPRHKAIIRKRIRLPTTTTVIPITSEPETNEEQNKDIDAIENENTKPIDIALKENIEDNKTTNLHLVTAPNPQSFIITTSSASSTPPKESDDEYTTSGKLLTPTNHSGTSNSITATSIPINTDIDREEATTSEDTEIYSTTRKSYSRINRFQTTTEPSLTNYKANSEDESFAETSTRINRFQTRTESSLGVANQEEQSETESTTKRTFNRIRQFKTTTKSPNPEVSNTEKEFSDSEDLTTHRALGSFNQRLNLNSKKDINRNLYNRKNQQNKEREEEETDVTTRRSFSNPRPSSKNQAERKLSFKPLNLDKPRLKLRLSKRPQTENEEEYNEDELEADISDTDDLGEEYLDNEKKYTTEENQLASQKLASKESSSSLLALRNRVRLGQTQIKENEQGLVNDRLKNILNSRTRTQTTTIVNGNTYKSSDQTTGDTEKEVVITNTVATNTTRFGTNRRNSTVANYLNRIKTNLSKTNTNTAPSHRNQNNIKLDSDQVDDDREEDNAEEREDDSYSNKSNVNDFKNNINKGDDNDSKRRFQKYKFQRRITTTSTTTTTENPDEAKEENDVAKKYGAIRTQVNDNEAKESERETSTILPDTTAPITTESLSSPAIPLPRRIKVLKLKRPVVSNINNTNTNITVNAIATNATNSNTSHTDTQNIVKLSIVNEVDSQIAKTQTLTETETIETQTPIPPPSQTSPTPKRIRKVIRKLIRPVNRTTEISNESENSEKSSVTTSTFLQRRQNVSRIGYNRSSKFQTLAKANEESSEETKYSKKDQIDEKKSEALSSRGRNKFTLPSVVTSTSKTSLLGSANRNRFGNRQQSSTTIGVSNTTEDDEEDDEDYEDNEEDDNEGEEEESEEEEEQDILNITPKLDSSLANTSANILELPRLLPTSTKSSIETKENESVISSELETTTLIENESQNFEKTTSTKLLNSDNLGSKPKTEQPAEQQEMVLSDRIRAVNTSYGEEESDDPLLKLRNKVKQDLAKVNQVEGVLSTRFKSIKTASEEEESKKSDPLLKLRNKVKQDLTKSNQVEGVLSDRFKSTKLPSDEEEVENDDPLFRLRNKVKQDLAKNNKVEGVLSNRLNANKTKADAEDQEDPLLKLRNKVKQELTKDSQEEGVVSVKLKKLLETKNTSNTLSFKVEDDEQGETTVQNILNLQKIREKVQTNLANGEQDQGVVSSKLKKLLTEKISSSTIPTGSIEDVEENEETTELNVTSETEDLLESSKPLSSRKPFLPKSKLTTVDSENQKESDETEESTTSAPKIKPTFRRKLVAKRPYVPTKPPPNALSSTTIRIPTTEGKNKYLRRKFGRFHPFNASNRNTGEGYVRKDPRGNILPGTNRFKFEGSDGVSKNDEGEDYEEYDEEEAEKTKDEVVEEEEEDVATKPVQPIQTVKPILSRPPGLFNRPQSTILKKPITLPKEEGSGENEDKNEDEVEEEDDNDNEDDEEEEYEDEEKEENEHESSQEDDKTDSNPPVYKPKDNRIPPGARPTLTTTPTIKKPFSSTRVANAPYRPSSVTTTAPSNRANRFGSISRSTVKPRVANRPLGVSVPNLTIKPVANDYERTTVLIPTKPAPFINPNTRAYERKYTGPSTEISVDLNYDSNPLIDDLNIEALNARNKKIFDINSKKHTNLKPKVITPLAKSNENTQEQQHINTEYEIDYQTTVSGVASNLNSNTNTQEQYTTQGNTIIGTQNTEEANQSNLNNLNEISSQDGFTTTPSPSSNLLHIFTVADAEHTTQYPLEDGFQVVPRLIAERVKPKHKVVEINRIVEVNSKEEKLRRKSKANTIVPVEGSQTYKIESLPHVEQLGEISVVKYVHQVDGSDITIEGRSTVTDYTPTEQPVLLASQPVRHSLPVGSVEERYGKALVPEVIREAIETSTISLEGLFESARKGKVLNTIIEDGDLLSASQAIADEIVASTESSHNINDKSTTETTEAPLEVKSSTESFNILKSIAFDIAKINLEPNSEETETQKNNLEATTESNSSSSTSSITTKTNQEENQQFSSIPVLTTTPSPETYNEESSTTKPEETKATTVAAALFPQYVRPIVPLLRPESNESSPLVISIANLDKVILSKVRKMVNGVEVEDDEQQPQTLQEQQQQIENNIITNSPSETPVSLTVTTNINNDNSLQTVETQTQQNSEIHDSHAEFSSRLATIIKAPLLNSLTQNDNHSKNDARNPLEKAREVTQTKLYTINEGSVGSTTSSTVGSKISETVSFSSETIVVRRKQPRKAKSRKFRNKTFTTFAPAAELLRTPATVNGNGLTVTRRPVLSVRRRLINSSTSATATSAAAANTQQTTTPSQTTQTDSSSSINDEYITTSKFKRLRTNRPPTLNSAAVDITPDTTAATSFKANNKFKKNSPEATSNDLKLASSLLTSSSSTDNDISTKQISKAQTSTALRRKFQARRLTTTTASNTNSDGTVTEQPRTQNPLFKRRYSLTTYSPLSVKSGQPSKPATTSSSSATTTAISAAPSTLQTVIDSLTTTVYVDGLENDEATDQVAKSSIHTSRFNQINGRLHIDEDDEEELDAGANSGDVRHVVNTVKPLTTLSSVTRQPASRFLQPPSQQQHYSKYNVDDVITRRMDGTGIVGKSSTGSSSSTTTTIATSTTTTPAVVIKKRKMVVKRRPQKATPSSEESLASKQRRRPHKYQEPFNRLNSNQAKSNVKTSTQPGRTYRPNLDYDYYDEEDVRLVGNRSDQQLKVILHGGGIIECLDQGNFPHPLSCRKFISCAKFETGGVVGWEYTCPKGLSYDPVGGMCNWAAGLGCKE